VCCFDIWGFNHQSVYYKKTPGWRTCDEAAKSATGPENEEYDQCSRAANWDRHHLIVCRQYRHDERLAQQHHPRQRVDVLKYSVCAVGDRLLAAAAAKTVWFLRQCRVPARRSVSFIFARQALAEKGARASNWQRMPARRGTSGAVLAATTTANSESWLFK